jgi:hypothetical protein
MPSGSRVERKQLKEHVYEKNIRKLLVWGDFGNRYWSRDFLLRVISPAPLLFDSDRCSLWASMRRRGAPLRRPASQQNRRYRKFVNREAIRMCATVCLGNEASSRCRQLSQAKASDRETRPLRASLYGYHSSSNLGLRNHPIHQIPPAAEDRPPIRNVTNWSLFFTNYNLLWRNIIQARITNS